MKKRAKDDKVSEEEIKLENEIIDIFRKSRNNYGARKIKKELAKIKIKVSRRKIGRIMVCTDNIINAHRFIIIFEWFFNIS